MFWQRNFIFFFLLVFLSWTVTAHPLHIQSQSYNSYHCYQQHLVTVVLDESFFGTLIGVMVKLWSESPADEMGEGNSGDSYRNRTLNTVMFEYDL